MRRKKKRYSLMVSVMGVTLTAAIMMYGCGSKREITLISNQELTSYYMVSGDQKVLLGKGKIVPICVDPEQRYEIIAEPVGYRPKSLFTTIPPTYELRFTFHISDQDGSVPDSYALAPISIEGLYIYNPPGKEIIALLPTQSDENGGVDSALGDRLNYLFSESKRFSIVERDRIKDAITELDFQQSDLVSQENAVKMGKLLGAQYIIISSVSRVGGGRKQLFLKLISVETAEQLVTAMGESMGYTVPLQTLIQMVNKINSVH